MNRGKDVFAKEETKPAGQGLPILRENFQVAPPAENPVLFSKDGRSPDFVLRRPFSLEGFVIAPVEGELETTSKIDTCIRPKYFCVRSPPRFEGAPEELRLGSPFLDFLAELGFVGEGISCEL
jgi:hypothetical protein